MQLGVYMSSIRSDGREVIDQLEPVTDSGKNCEEMNGGWHCH